MKTEVNGTHQLKCDACQNIIAESSYYPEKRGSMRMSLKNSDGDYQNYDLCNEICAHSLLSSRHEMRNKSVQIVAETKEVSFGRDGIVTLDFSTALKLRETK